MGTCQYGELGVWVPVSMGTCEYGELATSHSVVVFKILHNSRPTDTCNMYDCPMMTISVCHPDRFTKNMSVFRRDVSVSLRDVAHQTSSQTPTTTTASDMMV